MNIGDIVEMLLPEGTAERYIFRDNRPPENNAIDESYFAGSAVVPGHFETCPAWPPDVFAVVATIVDKSSCYTLAGPTPDSISKHADYLKTVAELANKWTNTSNLPPEISALWKKLVIDYKSVEIDDIVGREGVVETLFKLFAISDEACKGMGWTAPEPVAGNPTGGFEFSDLAIVNLTTGANALVSLPYMPYSLCSLVPANIAIVLPKSMTASVGCTIRSLSHHLALLPSSAQVSPSWHLADRPYTTDQKANSTIRLLIVPFPFHIPESSFQLGNEPQKLTATEKTAGFFKIEQKWLDKGPTKPHATGGPLSAEEIVRYLICPLIKQARKETAGHLDGVLMPECALTPELANEIADLLEPEGIDFFITGALKTGDEGKVRNVAQTHILDRLGTDSGHFMLEQSKHHRWRLDENQVRRYALNFPDESALPESERAVQWWEEIDVSRRCLPFYAIRQDMSLAVLICEDLARNDPAMPVIRAVGPNLVIALLMDGPQLATRWPGRYATVLADDPGSSVLSITCAGMVDRSNWLESRPVRSIGLWRDSGGRTQELNLPHDCQGMLLTLKANQATQHTLDSRSDRASTKKLSLASAIPLALARVPLWL